MDISLILFIVVIAYFTYRGYRNGLLKAISRILSLIAGYVAAIVYAKPVSIIIENEFQIHGVAAFITASIVLFVVAAIAVSLVFWIIGMLLPASTSRPFASSVGGATLGVVIGFIVATLVVWTFSFVRDMRAQETTASTQKLPENKIEKLAGGVVSKAVESAMSLSSVEPEVVNMSKALVESPADITNQFKRLSESNEVQALLQDPKNQAILDSGDVEAVKKLPAFQKLTQNPDLVKLIKSAGMIDDTSQSKEQVETAVANKLSDIWLRVNKVKDDKRVQEIINNPEFTQKIQSGNPLDLLNNPQLMELAEVIFSDTNTPQPGETNTDKAISDLPQKEQKIRSWKDEKGTLNITNIEE